MGEIKFYGDDKDFRDALRGVLANEGYVAATAFIMDVKGDARFAHISSILKTVAPEPIASPPPDEIIDSNMPQILSLLVR